MLNMFPPAAAGAGAPKLPGAAPKLVLGAPNVGAGFAGAPNGFGFAAGVAAGAAAPKLKTPEAV